MFLLLWAKLLAMICIQNCSVKYHITVQRYFSVGEMCPILTNNLCVNAETVL